MESMPWLGGGKKPNEFSSEGRRAMNARKWVSSRRRLSVVAVLVGIPLVAFAVAAWSGTAGKVSGYTLRAIPASAVHPSWQVPRIRNKNGTSSNWSGYAALPPAQNASMSSKGGNGKGGNGGKGKNSGSTAAFSDASGSWVVPEVAGEGTAASGYSSTWVGLDGYSTSTVEQIGTAQDLSNGQAQYYAWFEMYPKWAYEIVGFPVSPGDVISAGVEYAQGKYTLTIVNETQTANFSITQRSPSAQRQSAEWIVEAPWSGGVLPLADFGTVDFAGCYATMNGQDGAINDSQWQYDPITMQTADGTPKAVPSALTAGGTAFSVEWYHE
jgi:hypothetical protein